MNILIIATRSTLGRMTGRKMVLKTIRQSLAQLGHEVHYLVIGEKPQDGANAIFVDGPSKVRMLSNLVEKYMLGSWSMNECIYYDKKTYDKITKIIQDKSINLIVSDMIRTAPYCEGRDIPHVIDFDDLLSERYSMRTESGDKKISLGYFEEKLPKPVAKVAALLAEKLLSHESSRLARREVYHGAKAQAVSFVSPIEAQTFQTKTGIEAHSAAMSIATPKQLPPDYRHAHDSVVFIGGMDYQPNHEAIRYFQAEIQNHIPKINGKPVCLKVIGHCPDEIKKDLGSAQLEFLGYVDDISVELSKYRIFIAPIVSGTGIKTKVLEAMAHGLAVIGTPEAIKGIPVQNGVHCIIANTPAQFGAEITRLLSDPQHAEAMGVNARDLVQHFFSAPAIANKWQQIIQSVSPQPS